MILRTKMQSGGLGEGEVRRNLKVIVFSQAEGKTGLCAKGQHQVCVVAQAQVGKEFPDMRQNRVYQSGRCCQNSGPAQGRAQTLLQASSQFLQPQDRKFLLEWGHQVLGQDAIGWIIGLVFYLIWGQVTGRFDQRLVATVAMGLGQFQRFSSCDLGTGLHSLGSRTNCWIRVL